MKLHRIVDTLVINSYMTKGKIIISAIKCGCWSIPVVLNQDRLSDR